MDPVEMNLKMKGNFNVQVRQYVIKYCLNMRINYRIDAKNQS